MKRPAHSSTRRRFLQVSGYTALSVPLFGKNIVGANNTVRVALIGCGGRMGSLGGQFGKMKDVKVVAMCDPDPPRIDACLKKVKSRSGADLSGVEKIQDYRKVLERKDIDAVVIASPNHWHTLQSIEAMAAGKDVYVEKPVSHDIWEGQQLVAAEKKYDQIIAAGFQNRSDPGPIEGIKFVQKGGLGKIKSVHVCCFRNRRGIGKVENPLKPPSTCDYNLWLGPAQDLPMYRKNFHYDWHWIFNTGNGEVGNQTPHEIDLACWVLGDGPLPGEMQTFGGRFGWKDGGETPNMQTVWYEQAGVPCIIEVNDLHLSPKKSSPSVRKGIRVGIIVTCEGGELRGGRGGMFVVGEDGKTKTRKFKGNGGPGHQQNFIDAVRSRKKESLTSSIVSAERAAAVAHLANVSYQSGASAKADALKGAYGDHAMREMMDQILSEQTRQLAGWGLDKPDFQLGKKLTIDPAKAVVTNSDIDQKLVKPNYRKPFVIPQIG